MTWRQRLASMAVGAAAAVLVLAASKLLAAAIHLTGSFR